MGRMHKLDLNEGQLNKGNVIVDSGTTDTYFTSQAAGPFKKMWKQLTGKDYNHSPISLTEAQIDKLPTIILVISGMAGGDTNVGDEAKGNPNDIANYVGDVPDISPDPRDIVLAIPARHYMEFDPDNGKYVPRFYTEESSGSVLGANAMMGHDVYFDVARGRIGFAESDCDYTSLLMSEGGISAVPPPHSGVSTKTEVVPEQEEEEEEMEDDAADDVYSSVEQPGPDDQSENNESPYELFDNDKPTQGGHHSGKGGIEGMASEIFEDMKHECSSAGCRGIAALFILGAIAVVVAGVRRAMARRRVVRQYQEAELEISDLALESDSDEDEGGYVDEPPMSQIT